MFTYFILRIIKMFDFADLRDKNIAILGFWREGKSTLKFLLDHKVSFRNITILDTNKDLDSPEEVQKITWWAYLADIEKYDIIFKSSGVPITEQLKPYEHKIVTQVQMFFDSYPGKVIAVTASKGKSTITSLIYALLKEAGYRVKLVGNIGTPVFDEVAICPPVSQGGDPKFCPVQENDFVVIELSSYMLYHLRKKNYISILGTIFPEHLDRHGSFDKYVEAKLNILEWSGINIVHNATLKQFDLQQTYKNLIAYGAWSSYDRKEWYFCVDGQPAFPISERKIPWDHNVENITSVIALAEVLKIPMEVVRETIANFIGLPHRLQDIWVYGWIRRVDDAISTTPESTIEAIKTYGEQIDTIFLWGKDRGYNFEELVKCVERYGISNIVFFPESWERILKAFQDFHISTFQHSLETDDMKKAVKFAYAHTQPGKICLLSTASPSYSIWKDFEEKWNLFQQYVKELATD